MSILVTGAAGFIGFHLINNLLNENYNVIGIDSMCNYYDINIKYKRLELLGLNCNDLCDNIAITNNNSFTFIKSDIENKTTLEEIFNTFNVAYVVNLAAQPGVRYSIENPDTYIQTNIMGFLNLLNISLKFNVKHFIYASSSSVYGLNQTIPYKESICADHPVSVYAATKRCDELLAHSYSALYKLPTTGLRFFTVYGPWGRPDMAAYKFANSIINNRPINIFNEGKMTRDFTYIDDIIDGIKLVLFEPPKEHIDDDCDEDPSISSVPFVIYNIGSSKPITLMEFINYFEKTLRKTAIKNFLPMQKGDVKCTYADISKIKNKFHFNPKVSIEEGIKRYIEWHLHYYNNY